MPLPLASQIGLNQSGGNLSNINNFFQLMLIAREKHSQHVLEHSIGHPNYGIDILGIPSSLRVQLCAHRSFYKVPEKHSQPEN